MIAIVASSTRVRQYERAGAGIGRDIALSFACWARPMGPGPRLRRLRERDGIVVSTERLRQIPVGVDVVGSDGAKLGEVVATTASYLVVEKGFFFPTDYYVPFAAVADFDGDRVTLTVAKEEARHQGWDVIPGDETVGTETGAFITGATAYDESMGLPSPEGVAFTDADLRVAGAFSPEDSLAESATGDPEPPEIGEKP
jgi:hypothetical protein